MKLTQAQSDKLEYLASLTVNLEYGTDSQIDAQNTFFIYSEQLTGIDWQSDEHSQYLNHATTPEMIEYAIVQIDKA